MKFVKYMLSGVIIVAFMLVSPAVFGENQRLASAFDKQCPTGKRADNFKDWEFIADNAARTADQYAINRNPRATFINATAEAVFQIEGKYAGIYLVKVLAKNRNITSIAMLRPNFDFCTDPSSLDDSQKNLFTVVVAKFNGRPF